MPNIQERNYFEELYQATQIRNIAIIQSLLTQVHVDIQDPVIGLTVAGKFAYEAKDSSAQFLYQNFNASPDTIGEGYARNGDFLQAKRWCINYGAHPTSIAQGLAFRGDKNNYNEWKAQYSCINISSIRDALVLGKQQSEKPYSSVICQLLKHQDNTIYSYLYCIAQVASIEEIKALVDELIKENLSDNRRWLLAIIAGLQLKNRNQDAEYLQENTGIFLDGLYSILLRLYTTLIKGRLIQNEKLLDQYKNDRNFEIIIQFTALIAINSGYIAYAQKLYHSYKPHYTTLLKAAWENPFQVLNMLYQSQSITLKMLYDETPSVHQIYNISHRFWNLSATKHSLIAIQAPKLRYIIINELKSKKQIKNPICSIIVLG